MNYLTQQQDVASRLRLDLNQADQLALVKRWLNQSQAEIWSRYDWPWALDRETVQTVSDKTAGTVSVNASATAVTGTSTSFAAVDVGKYIQFSSTSDWYRISAVASATALTLEKNYVGTSNLSAGTYTIRQFFYSTSSAAERIIDARQVVGPHFMELMSYRDFDFYRPNPIATGKPSRLISFGVDGSGNLRFMLYPFPDSVMNVELKIKKLLTNLAADGDVSSIPEKWHATVMIDGALYRGLEYLSLNNPQATALAAVTKRSFLEGIDAMKAEAEPDGGFQPVLQTREYLNIPFFPRLPNQYGAV